MERFLSDSFSKKGKNYEDFKKECQNMAENTHILRTFTGETQFLSYCALEKAQKEDRTPFFILRMDYLERFQECGQITNIGTINNSEFFPELLKESIEDTDGLILVHNGYKYLVSDLAMFTLLKQCSLGGTVGRKKSSLIRNMHIAEAAYQKNIDTSFVYREETNDEGMPIRKVFAALGAYYSYIPQDILISVADRLMEKWNIEISEWSVDHKCTSIRMSFNEYKFKIGAETYVPGLLLKTSDIGESMLYVQCVLNTPGNYIVIGDELCYKHNSKSVSEEQIFEDCFKFTASMEDIKSTMAALSKEVITDTPETRYSTISEVIKTVGKVIQKELPCKRYQRIMDCLIDNIDSTREYNLADICAVFFSIPQMEEGDLNDVPLLTLRKEIATLPNLLSDEAVAKRLTKK